MTHDEFWQAVLGEIELSLSKASFTTWFKNTSVNQIEDSEFILNVPNIFAKEWLEKKYRKIILESVQKFYPKVNKFSCLISDSQEASRSIDSIVNIKNKQQNNSSVQQKQNHRTKPSLSRPFRDFSVNSNLNNRYNFNSFVIGSNNELAYAACRSVAENPGKNYNPLFVYGGVGLGKTHLLQSTGNEVLKNFPDKKVKYISMERFANELVSAIQTSKAKDFKNEYIQLDVLIIDDVQFLSNKEKTQEEFFHVFESLYQLEKQIIISSDRPPKSIPTLEDRLRSRFEGGMMADISKPDLETRMAIIKKKLLEKNFNLEDDIIVYLAENIYHNVRELEVALNKIIVTYQLKNYSPSLSEIMDQTGDVISTNRQKDLSPEKIICSVAEFFDVNKEEISGRCRKKKIIKPRQIAIYLLRTELNLSFPEIGKVVGGRDHSTAIYACGKIEKELENNKLMEDHLKFIKEKFVDF
jgi:chromosomal replication initiator protein